MKLNSKKTNNPIKKWANKQTFLQGRPTDGQKHMKRCSTSLDIREMQIKTIMRHHFAQIGMANINMSKNNKCWKVCREKGILLYHWLECRLV